MHINRAIDYLSQTIRNFASLLNPSLNSNLSLYTAFFLSVHLEMCEEVVPSLKISFKLVDVPNYKFSYNLTQ